MRVHYRSLKEINQTYDSIENTTEAVYNYEQVRFTVHTLHHGNQKSFCSHSVAIIIRVAAIRTNLMGCLFVSTFQIENGIKFNCCMCVCECVYVYIVWVLVCILCATLCNARTMHGYISVVDIDNKIANEHNIQFADVTFTSPTHSTD